MPPAPNTLATHPFATDDPFVLRACPHVLFAGYQPASVTRVATGAAQGSSHMMTATVPVCMHVLSEATSARSPCAWPPVRPRVAANDDSNCFRVYARAVRGNQPAFAMRVVAGAPLRVAPPGNI